MFLELFCCTAVGFFCGIAIAFLAINLAKREIDRLRRGDFTPEEFQEICHNLDQRRPGLKRAEFEEGCRVYQAKIFREEKP